MKLNKEVTEEKCLAATKLVTMQDIRQGEERRMADLSEVLADARGLMAVAADRTVTKSAEGSVCIRN